ncbi:MAG: YigZ family protein [Blautia sp.]
MLECYKTVYEGGQGEIVEKKSRFIATVRPVEKEEEALAFLEEVKKKYWDARHNCFAYVIGERQELARCSDDGEPGGTAGRPMLDVLLGEEIHNVAVVVTRYFGGTLLGTGGLVRAYSKAVQEGLAHSTVIEKQWGVVLAVSTDYNGVGKLQYLAGERKLPVLDAQYTEKVVMKLLVPIGEVDAVEKAVTEATSGRAGLHREKELYFASVNGKYQLFDH